MLNRIKHPRVALAVHGAAAIALVPAFVWLAPPSQWDKPGLLMVLLALAVIAYVTEITLPNGLSFDAALELVLITLVLIGPVPAFLVAVVPIGIGGHARGSRWSARATWRTWPRTAGRRLRAPRCSPRSA